MAREQALALKAAAPVRTLLARALRVHTDEWAWRIGADGEEKVAARLAKLTRRDPRWRILHAIPVGEKGSDIDHLVIGPGGIYTLNAKHHPGANIWVGGDTVLINGQRQPHIRNSRHEASRASRLLSAASGLPVVAAGTVVVVGASQIAVKTPPRDVFIVTRADLTNWLRRQPERLNTGTIDAIFDAARRSTTWHPPA
ncbi:MAG: NERD domain-containing protein [Pseudonocardiales bacterium]|nr:MAG: NERD domain-containing protein [Pseudonocardiales bacterium]